MHFFFYLFLFVVTFAEISIGSDLKNENIKWYDPIIKFVSNNHKVTSGYLTIENNGDRDLILKSVFSNISEITEIHSMIVKDDIMKMEKVQMPILIPKGKKLIIQRCPNDSSTNSNQCYVYDFKFVKRNNIL